MQEGLPGLRITEEVFEAPGAERSETGVFLSEAVISIPDGEVLEGEIPRSRIKLVLAWIEIHQEDLMADWQLAANGQTPYKIDPLR
jgi:hypothetical protein